LVAEAEENNWDDDRFFPMWDQWHMCRLCEQEYHGAVSHALGWGCWKTYLGRPETDWPLANAMTILGNGLYAAQQQEDALSVREAELSMRRRLGDSEENILGVQSNLAIAYVELGRHEEALKMHRDVYFGHVRLKGEENYDTIRESINYASSLGGLKRFEEARSLLRRTLPVARCVLSDSHDITLSMRLHYAAALCKDPAATLGDLREAVATLEVMERTARQVFGGSHPLVRDIENHLRYALAALRARATGNA
jgi:tetratricopeptide (TPR) repeat protein